MRLRWLWDVFEFCGVGHPGKKRDRAHMQYPLFERKSFADQMLRRPVALTLQRPEKFPLGRTPWRRRSRASRGPGATYWPAIKSRHPAAANCESPPRNSFEGAHPWHARVRGTKDSGPKVDRRKFLTGVAVAGAAGAVAPQAANATVAAGAAAARLPSALPPTAQTDRRRDRHAAGRYATGSAASPAPTSWSTSSRRSTSNICRRTALRASAASTSR